MNLPACALHSVPVRQLDKVRVIVEKDVPKSSRLCGVDYSRVDEPRLVKESQYCNGVVVNVRPKLYPADLY